MLRGAVSPAAKGRGEPTTLSDDAPTSAKPPLIELSAYDDGSTDDTWSLLEAWAPRLRAAGLRVVLSRSGLSAGGGCGHAKNRAVAQSSGEWLCFQDVDDVSLPERLQRQLEAALKCGPSCLLGARVRRVPEGSTPRYTSWANSMSQAQLATQRFRECTLLMPTWFLSRAAFAAGGGFREEKCEDLLFLHAHVLAGGTLQRVDDVLVEYTYHTEAVTHSTPRKLLLTHRVAAIERAVLTRWPHFTIWGAGRDGRDFFKALSVSSKQRVKAFCDVDAKKVGTTYQFFEFNVPIVHYTDATPPFVTCVALDRTNGEFEANLASLQLEEGRDFYFFC